MHQPLENRVALVTGASRGLGEAIALSLAQAGAGVALGYHTQHISAEEAARRCQNMGVCTSMHGGDLGDPDTAARYTEECMQSHGRLDLLIANAGVTLNRLLPRTDAADWDRVLEVNLHATFRLCRAALPHLRESRGQIIFISSHAASFGKAGLSAYSASKAALLGLMRSIAREEGANGIRANMICPGYLETDMGQTARAEVIAAAQSANLLGRLGNCAEVAAFVTHLCQMEAVSGQVFHLDSRPV